MCLTSKPKKTTAKPVKKEIPAWMVDRLVSCRIDGPLGRLGKGAQAIKSKRLMWTFECRDVDFDMAFHFCNSMLQKPLS